MKKSNLWAARIIVLILVLMDNQVTNPLACMSRVYQVLILVLMDNQVTTENQ